MRVVNEKTIVERNLYYWHSNKSILFQDKTCTNLDVIASDAQSQCLLIKAKFSLKSVVEVPMVCQETVCSVGSAYVGANRRIKKVKL